MALDTTRTATSARPTPSVRAYDPRPELVEWRGAVVELFMPGSERVVGYRQGLRIRIRRRKVAAAYGDRARVLVAEDELFLAGAIRDGLRLEAIAGDGQAALDLLAVNAYDVVVLDRDLPVVHGDEVARHVCAEVPGTRVIMVTAAHELEDKLVGFGLGADDYLTKPFELAELVLRLRALARRPERATPPVLELAGVRLDSFRREVHRDGHYVRLTRKQFSVLAELIGAGGGVVSAEDLLERVWDANADPFTNAVRITISTLRKQLGRAQVIHTVSGVGYRVGAAAPGD